MRHGESKGRNIGIYITFFSSFPLKEKDKIHWINILLILWMPEGNGLEEAVAGN